MRMMILILFKIPTQSQIKMEKKLQKIVRLFNRVVTEADKVNDSGLPTLLNLQEGLVVEYEALYAWAVRFGLETGKAPSHKRAGNKRKAVA